jgi:hypothetical protein
MKSILICKKIGKLETGKYEVNINILETLLSLVGVVVHDSRTSKILPKFC